MKKNLLLLSALLLGTLSAISQNNVWSLPGYYLKLPLTQTGLLPTNNDYYGEQADYAHNAMQDAQGNLLF
jgi:hypothetical protein